MKCCACLPMDIGSMDCKENVMSVKERIAISLDFLKGNERKAVKLILKKCNVISVRVKETYFDEKLGLMVAEPIVIEYSHKDNPREVFTWELEQF
jgi:hypothetical protein